MNFRTENRFEGISTLQVKKEQDSIDLSKIPFLLEVGYAFFRGSRMFKKGNPNSKREVCNNQSNGIPSLRER